VTYKTKKTPSTAVIGPRDSATKTVGEESRTRGKGKEGCLVGGVCIPSIKKGGLKGKGASCGINFVPKRRRKSKTGTKSVD